MRDEPPLSDDEIEHALYSLLRRPASRSSADSLIVYAIRFGPYIKIGVTSNAKNRLKDIPHEEILMEFPSVDGSEEGWLHERFAAHKAEAGSQQEWFHDVSEIREALARFAQ